MKRKKAYEGAIEKAGQETRRLQAQPGGCGLDPDELEKLKHHLATLRGKNLESASFEERTELIALLGIQVYPSEDLKSRRIVCQLNRMKDAEQKAHAGFAKVVSGPPHGIRTPLC